MLKNFTALEKQIFYLCMIKIISRLHRKGNAFFEIRLGFKETYDEHRAHITCDVSIQYTFSEHICIDNVTLARCDGNDRERRKRGNAVFLGL